MAVHVPQHTTVTTIVAVHMPRHTTVTTAVAVHVPHKSNISSSYNSGNGNTPVPQQTAATVAVPAVAREGGREALQQTNNPHPTTASTHNGTTPKH